MKIIFSPEALDDYNYFKKVNPKIADRIKNLLGNIVETPFTGIGHPEPLRYALSGYWSRRITDEHRLVYRVEEDSILVVACRYHYK